MSDPLAFAFSPPNSYMRQPTPSSSSIRSPPPAPAPIMSPSSTSWDSAAGAVGSNSSPTASARVPDSTAIESMGKGKERGWLRVRITGLERNRKDLLIRFDATTNLSNFRTGVYRNMQRSYVEFQKFAEQAQLTSPQTIIPALPLASTSATTDEEDDRLVRIALQRWLARISEDPALLLDEELRSFIESDFGVNSVLSFEAYKLTWQYSPTPPPTARRTSSAPLAFTAAISKVVRRGPLDEDDELASARGALDKLEGTWGGAAGAINNLGKARRANQEVGAKLINLSTVESDFHLSAAERKLGRALEGLAGLAGAQTASENVVLSDSLGYQALNARAAKVRYFTYIQSRQTSADMQDALLQRTQLLEDYQTSSKSSISKRRNVERLKGSNTINPSKVDDAIAEMQDAESLESTLSRQLSAISTNLHLSLRQHSRNTHEDVALALLENARLSVGFHKAMLRELEAVRADLAKVNGAVEAYPGVPAPRAGTRTQAGQSSSTIPAHGQTGMSASASQPHMTSSRPYDSQPASGPSRVPPSAAGTMGTSQSMFLPPPPASSDTRPPPPTQQPQQQQATPDPLGGHMTQSMVLPPGHRPSGAAGRSAGTTGKRLDSRQAAKLLAGGF